jgi:hypothetical protein
LLPLSLSGAGTVLLLGLCTLLPFGLLGLRALLPFGLLGPSAVLLLGAGTVLLLGLGALPLRLLAACALLFSGTLRRGPIVAFALLLLELRAAVPLLALLSGIALALLLGALSGLAFLLLGLNPLLTLGFTLTSHLAAVRLHAGLRLRLRLLALLIALELGLAPFAHRHSRFGRRQRLHPLARRRAHVAAVPFAFADLDLAAVSPS